jgi:vesicle transport protein SEC22
MIMLTMIGRSGDGLILSAAGITDSDFGNNQDSMIYQDQAKKLFKTIRADSPPQMTIETGPYVFHYLLENRICYLCLCEKTFSKRLAFTYLGELATEFQQRYGQQLYSVNRPYSFIEFDTYIQYARKKSNAAKSRRNINMLSNDLQDVQRIMVQNIGDVLQRGVAISDLDTKASSLSLMSQNYKKGARLLNTRATYAKVAAGGIIMLCLALYFWIL